MHTLKLLSDLHINVNGEKQFSYLWEKDHFPHDLFICGDLGSEVKQNVDFITRCSSKWNRIIYLPGNHEYYGGDIPHIDNEYRQAFRDTNIHYCNESWWSFPEYDLYAGTLWSNPNPVQELVILDEINDFRYIKLKGQIINCNDFRDRNANFLRNYAITKAIYRNTKVPLIVASHFLPNVRSIHPAFANDPTNSYYCNALEDDFFKDITHWMHGHTHKSMQYKIYDCVVSCNPYGYGRENGAFIKDYSIEI